MNSTKVCNKCKTEKLLTSDYFYKRKASKDGFMNYCKVCTNRLNQENHHKNREKRQEYMKTYAQNNKEKMSEIHKKYYNKNREKAKQRNLKYYYETKERYRKRLKEWRKNNPDKVQIQKVKRRTLEKELISTLTAEEWGNCKAFFENKCAYCGIEKELTLDHFIPLSKSGELSTFNAIPACKSCNSSKNNKNFFEWYPTYKYYSKTRERKILKFLGYENKVQQLSIL